MSERYIDRLIDEDYDRLVAGMRRGLRRAMDRLLEHRDLPEITLGSGMLLMMGIRDRIEGRQLLAVPGEMEDG